MEFFSEHWGDLSSAAGFILAFIGFAWAAKQSGKARSSAEAAKEAADTTKNAIGQHLLIIDLERSINLIQRLKLLHSAERWDAALEQYQVLRAMLSAIIARYPANESEPSEQLSKARTSITEMEEYVESQVHQGLENDDVVELNQRLNLIQIDLEDMSNSMELGG
jgi:hypothetical protein